MNNIERPVWSVREAREPRVTTPVRPYEETVVVYDKFSKIEPAIRTVTASRRRELKAQAKREQRKKEVEGAYEKVIRKSAVSQRFTALRRAMHISEDAVQMAREDLMHVLKANPVGSLHLFKEVATEHWKKIPYFDARSGRQRPSLDKLITTTPSRVGV